MVMDIIATKRRLDLSWEIIEDSELQKILNLLDSRVFHTVVYPDPQSGEEYTITAYVGNLSKKRRSSVLARRIDGSDRTIRRCPNEI